MHSQNGGLRFLSRTPALDLWTLRSEAFFTCAANSIYVRPSQKEVAGHCRSVRSLEMNWQVDPERAVVDGAGADAARLRRRHAGNAAWAPHRGLLRGLRTRGELRSRDPESRKCSAVLFKRNHYHVMQRPTCEAAQCTETKMAAGAQRSCSNGIRSYEDPHAN